MTEATARRFVALRRIAIATTTLFLVGAVHAAATVSWEDLASDDKTTSDELN